MEEYEPAEEEQSHRPKLHKTSSQASVARAESRSLRLALSRSRSANNRVDIARQLELERDDNGPPERSTSTSSDDGKVVICFEENDKGDPKQWSQLKKSLIVLVGILTVLNSTLGSSLPGGDIPNIARVYGVTKEAELVLPNSIYLTGYVLGPLVFAPLSETHGRQVVMIGTFIGFTVFTLAICFAPNFASFLIFRLFMGIFGSSPVSVIGGLYADLYADATSRGRAMAIFMAATTYGSVVGPLVSGYLAPYGWKWPFWFGLIFTVVTLIPLCCLPETYAPTILSRRAKKMRKADPMCNKWAAIDLENKDLREMILVILTRPFRMFFYEAIVLFSCLYLALIYAVLYMFFQAYAIIFPDIYGFSLGQEGLAFLPIGIGATFSALIYLYWDHYLAVALATKKPWALKEEYRRLPLACVGGILYTIGLFWIAWTARPSVHWIVPILGGLFFGCGFLLLFMALINYLVDAYEIFAASALAAASCVRSLFGAVLPFAAVPMYDRLGVAWATSLLGFASLGMCVIPFVFIRYGDRIRANSRFCQFLAEKKMAEAEAEEEGRRRGRGEKRASQATAVEQEV